MWKRVKVTKKVPGNNGWWDEKKKYEVIQAYIILGTIRQAAITCNVPEITVKKWKATAFWKETEDDLRRGSKLQLSAKLSELVNRAAKVLGDRIDNGDFIQAKEYNPTTKQWDFVWKRKPISAEHANKITTQLIDRVIAVEKHAVPEKVTDEGLEARLLKLKNEMLAFAKAKPILIKGEFTDVLPIEDKGILFEPVQETASTASCSTESGSTPAGSSAESRGDPSSGFTIEDSAGLSTPDSISFTPGG